MSYGKIPPIEEAYDKIKELRYQRKTLKQIGEYFGVSRERIRQILVKKFPNEPFPRSISTARQRWSFYKFTCTFCSKEGEARYPNRKYCDNTCLRGFFDSRQIKMYGKVLQSEKKETQNIRHKVWYDRVKNNPEFKKKISQYNKNQFERRKNAARKSIPFKS